MERRRLRAISGARRINGPRARFHDRQLLLVFVGTIMMYHIAVLGPALMYVAQPSTKGFIMHTMVSLVLMPVSILIGGLCVEPRPVAAASKVPG